MSIARAAIAFLEALDGGRTRTGQPQPADQPVQMESRAPVQRAPEAAELMFGQKLEQLMARVADLEAQLPTIKTQVRAELDDAVRKAESARRAAQRAAERIRAGEVEPDPDQDVQGFDGAGGDGAGMYAVPADVADPRGYPSLQDRNAAARRAVALM